jgi:general secretion pathway protein J
MNIFALRPRHEDAPGGDDGGAVSPEIGGFTLLELLVALVVLGIVLAGLAEGTHFGLLTWKVDERLSSADGELVTADAVVRHVIEGMSAGDELNPAPIFGGTNALGCVTTLPRFSDAMPLRRMRAALLVDSAHRLVLRWRPYLHATELGAGPGLTNTVLLARVAGIEVSYWWPDGGWLSSWRRTDLPTLVRVRLIFPAGDPRNWPDVVAGPLLDRP